MEDSVPVTMGGWGWRKGLGSEWSLVSDEDLRMAPPKSVIASMAASSWEISGSVIREGGAGEGGMRRMVEIPIAGVDFFIGKECIACKQALFFF